MSLKNIAYFILCAVIHIKGEYEGDACVNQDMEGICMNIRKCKSAIDDIRNHRATPKLCSFTSTDPIVCCMDNPKKITYQPPVATTNRPRSTTEYVPPMYDYVLNDKVKSEEDGCEALPPSMTPPKIGQKAWDKCIEYQQKYVYPCERGVDLTGKMARTNKCKHSVIDLIVGGVAATEAEFPHMALLGYGKTESSSQWLCGGSIISERYILTAGHCTSSRDFGNVTYARTALQRRTEPINSLRTYKIKNIIKHPEYNPPHRYNDIALLEVDRDMQLDQFAVPACLDLGSPNTYDRALASGWGATKNRGSNADELQKVVLEKFSTGECSELFPSMRLMVNGFDEKTQICYGDKNMSKDTCQGDSGGPLQLKHKQINCMYTVIGVTSFGRACGYIGEPGIYTRVAAYVPWIESVVWP
ncbi:unnamed protein product, partial [Brenthis ino]